MQEVWVKDSRIFIWPGVHTEVGENVKVLSSGVRRAFILTDKNCLPIGRRVAMTMQQTGIQVGGCAIVPVPQHRGETVVPRVLARMEKFGMDFRTVFIGVGGNLVLDLAASIASAEEPGLTLYQVPTTLSSLLDGSVGGRTLTYDREGKRMERKWVPPKATFADPTVVDSLPLRRYISGLAEAVKVSMAQDAELGKFLTEQCIGIRERIAKHLEILIYRAATAKSAAVDNIQKTSGALRVLEYGYSLGRIFADAAGSNAIQQGEALALGMETQALIGREMGVTDEATQKAQAKLLNECGLPRRIKGLSPQRVQRAIQKDSKYNLVLPEAMGRARPPVSVPAATIQKAIAALIR